MKFVEERQKMKFTIVMASYLGPYNTAAKDRHSKIHRAIKSVLTQSFTDFELFIIADGCPDSFQVAEQYKADPRVRCSQIEKQPVLSGNVRNFGIADASGEWIAYLDIDDYFGPEHLSILASQLSAQPWVYFNDYKWERRTSLWVERLVYIDKRFQHGTSNICHRSGLNIYWRNTGYQHDFYFVQDLKKLPGYHKIKTPEYYVCHIPNQYDI